MMENSPARKRFYLRLAAVCFFLGAAGIAKSFDYQVLREVLLTLFAFNLGLLTEQIATHRATAR